MSAAVMSKTPKSRRAPTKLCMSFGEKVRALRKRKGWSLEELAGRSEMHATYLSSIERGHRNPTLNMIGDIAAALDVSLSTILEGLQNGG